jgi:hypothetical protein
VALRGPLYETLARGTVRVDVMRRACSCLVCNEAEEDEFPDVSGILQRVGAQRGASGPFRSR